VTVLGVANDGYFPFQVIAASTNGYIYNESSPQNVSKGGFGHYDYSEYRKYLEKLNGISVKTEITPEIVAAAEALTELPEPVKQLSNVISVSPQIDFAALELELANILEYINRMELASMQMQRLLREQDDELALMLLI
jgi:hypothetical protein